MEETTENIKVFIRIRPQNEREQLLDRKDLLKLRDNTITLSKTTIEKTFNFSKIFNETSSQIELYRTVASPIVEKLFSGYNGTIFAYGQSGTGKTYTMIGDITKADKKGIIPNIFSHIFTQISFADKDIAYVVSVTYLEIYNEEIRDLLSDNPTKKLTIHEKPGVGVFVKDLLGFTVNSLESITDILAKGNKNRVTGATRVNDISSRSHAVFSIQIEVKNKLTNKTVYGKLNLVDLAGSERVARTLASGDRLKEAGKINLSLSVLGNVISALIDIKSTHIPYRNSKLTRLLQGSLGGNSLTSMIAMLSPNDSDCEENMYTLMYADRVKHIQNHVTVNIEKQSLIDTFESKIAMLKKELEMLTFQEYAKNKLCRQEECDKIQIEKKNLITKINVIQKKILTGGENLMKKAQVQIELLNVTEKELHHLDSAHELLKEVLHNKTKEKHAVEKEFLNLQEEDQELNRQIEEAEKQIKRSVQVLEKKENEYQNEISSLLYTNKVLAREMALVDFVVKNVVPNAYLNKLQSNLIWDDEIQEWQIKGISYCGNNMRENQSIKAKESVYCPSVYKKYRSRKKH